MKKIMFDDRYGLTKAVLEGRKTMTRRSISEDVWQRADVYRHKYYEDTLDLLPWKKALIEFSPFKVGEVVAVAQSYKEVYWPYVLPNITAKSPGWNNKMFVSADRMPHQIRITDVRVERLQDISDEDCLLEGIDRVYYGDEVWFRAYDKKDACVCAKRPKGAFAALIDKISGKGTWESNPWVFVYEFELVK